MNSILCLCCPDQKGIVAKITGEIAKHNGNILTAEQYTDTEENEFYCRILLEHEPREIPSMLKKSLQAIAKDLKGELSLSPEHEKQRVVIMATKATHCLTELLWRHAEGELHADLVGIIANHEVIKPIVRRYGQRFEHIEIDESRGFDKVSKIWEEWEAQTIVLARFMRVIPKDLCERYAGKIINIHHSFLPSFVGAKPYHQAKERGVKLIGATCHYASKDIDQGPIIEQNVVRVEHYHTTKALIKLGQDCEKITLAQGLQLHLEKRVFIHKNQTIIFRH
jgi:formyltetrahydrofolate deformylase